MIDDLLRLDEERAAFLVLFLASLELHTEEVTQL